MKLLTCALIKRTLRISSSLCKVLFITLGGVKVRVFVDDIREVEGFDYTALTADDFFQFCIDNNVKHIELLSLDHDLGESHALTGYDIVKNLPDLNLSIGTIQFHTANPVGFENMMMYAKNLKKHGVMKIDHIIEDCLDSRDF